MALQRAVLVLKAVGMLILAGADINALTSEGSSALDVAQRPLGYQFDMARS